MNDISNSGSPISASVCIELLADLESMEHMLFEPMSQPDYDRLRTMYNDWVERLRDSPETVMICDALDDFIDANLEEMDIETAYMDLYQLILSFARQ